MKKIKVCFFGTYDREYSSNKILLQGLRMAGVDVFELNVDTRISRLNTDQDMGIIPLIKRILKKASIVPLVIKNYKKIQASDTLFVGYPGHIDLILAIIIAKLFHKKLVFYPLILLYITFTDDVKLFSKDSYKAKLIKWFETILYRFPDIIVADIPFQKRLLQKLFHVPLEKIRELPIGADDSIYQYHKQKRKRDFHVVYYGLFSPLHGVSHVLHAASLLKHKKNIRFFFVGRGQTYEENVALSKKLRLSNVTFVDNASEKDALSVLQSADVFLGFMSNSPTVHRVLPNKVYQGLALGRTVVTADTKATRSVFTHMENAVLTKPADPSMLSQIILRLERDRELNEHIARNGHQLFSETYSVRAVGKRLSDIFSEVVGKEKEGSVVYPTLTIGIPTYEAGQSLVRTLKSIYSQELFSAVHEVLLIVDGNNIPKNIKKKIEHEKLTIIYAKKRQGQSARINDIFRLSKSDFLFLTNDDVILDKGAVFSIFEKIRKSSDGLLSCNVRPVPGKHLFQQVINVGFLINDEISKNWNKGDNYLTCNGRGVVLAKKLYKNIRIPKTMWNNDAYLYLHNKKSGYSYGLISDAIVRYKLPINAEEHVRQSTKFLHSLDENKKHLGVQIIDDYHVSLFESVRAAVIIFLTHPFLSVGYYTFFLYTRLGIVKEKYRPSKNYWETDLSTKTV